MGHGTEDGFRNQQAGSRAPGGPKDHSENTYIASNMRALVSHLNSCGTGADIVECSGGPHASTFAVRRVLPNGTHADVATYVNLRDPHEHSAMWAYLRNSEPLLVVMPVPHASASVDADSAAHCRLLGTIAAHQRRAGTSWLSTSSARGRSTSPERHRGGTSILRHASHAVLLMHVCQILSATRIITISHAVMCSSIIPFSRNPSKG